MDTDERHVRRRESDDFRVLDMCRIRAKYLLVLNLEGDGGEGRILAGEEDTVAQQ